MKKKKDTKLQQEVAMWTEASECILEYLEDLRKENKNLRAEIISLHERIQELLSEKEL